MSQAFPDVPIVQTSSTNAELSKYVINTFLATKVSYFNEIYELVEALAKTGLDVDYDRTIECAKLDKRLGNSHFQVPGPMPADDNSGRFLKGYGGSCLCKDMNSLAFLAKSLGVNTIMLDAGWNKNLYCRPEKDWINLVGRAVSTSAKEPSVMIDVGNRSNEEAQEYAKSKAVELGHTVIPVRK